MFGHIMDKWDSYLSILLGIFLIAVVATKIANSNPQLLVLFKYYVFAMGERLKYFNCFFAIKTL